MPGQPYQVAIIVYDTDGSTLLNNVQVTLRQEATNESLEETSNASGEVVFNLADYPSGWTVGDIVTAYIFYKSYTAEVSHTTTSGGGVTLSLTLVASPSAPSLRYYAPQDFLDYFNMLTYNADPENGVKMQQLIKIGEMVEGGIDDDTGTKFDDNDGSYYSITEEFHDAERNQAVYNATRLPIQELKGFFVNTSGESSTPNWDNIAYDSIDPCSVTTNWSGTSANSEVTLSINSNPNNANEGTACLYIAKAGTNDTTLTIERTNITARRFEDKTLKIDVYMDDTTEFASSSAVTLKFGSSASAYYQKTFDRTSFSNGWNTVEMDFDDTDVTVTGNPDLTACDYFVIILELVGATTELTAGDARLDDLRFDENYELDVKNARGEISITDSKNYPEKGKNQVKMEYTYGRSTVPLDIKELAIMETGLRMFGASFLRSKIGDRQDAKHDFTEWWNRFRFRVINKYVVTAVDSIHG